MADPSDLDRARTLDLSGNLDAARDHIRSSLAAGRHFGASEKAEYFWVQARVMRHRADPVSLRTARDTAAHALRLTEIVGDERDRALAELELSACLAASGQPDEATTLAQAWLNSDRAEVSGWAWTLVGQAHLDSERFFHSVAAVQNAMAEFSRGGRHLRQRSARILLGEALSRGGRLSDAANVLDQDRLYWSQKDSPLRIRVRYLMARAANHHQLGQVGEALKQLRRAETLLHDCTGMGGTRVRLLHQFAECLEEWGQQDLAAARLSEAHELTAEVALHALPPAYPLAPMRPPIAVGITLRDPPPLRRPREQLGTSPQTAPRIKSRETSPRRSKHVRQATTNLAEQINMALGYAEQFAGSATVTPSLVRLVERMQGVPGLERAEATALVTAGALLRSAGAESLLISERLLRRALVRLELLDGMRICQARAMLELGLTLAAAGKQEEALTFVLDGAMRLDRQRFSMRRRDFRAEWLRNEIHPAFELGIELALQRGRADIASDLIVFSRTAGFVAAEIPGTDREQADLPLLPVPHQRDLDAMSSSWTIS